MIEKVRSGQQFNQTPLYKSTSINEIIDAANAHQANALGRRGAGESHLREKANLVSVRNDSGSPLLRGQCLQVGVHLLGQIYPRELWFAGDVPAEPLRGCVLLRDACKDGKIAEAFASGVCTAIINVTDTAHCYANPVDGQVVLSSGPIGMFEILSPVDSSGEQELIVRFVHRATDYDNQLNTIINNYSTIENWKLINIDNTISDHYGLTVCYGPYNLTTFSNDTAVGTKAWEDAGDAISSNDTYASNYDLNQNGMITNYLKALQMDGAYSPAGGFVPKVVHVTIERRDTGDRTLSLVKDHAVKLVVGGVVQADNQASPLAWPESDEKMIYRFLTTASRAQTLAGDFGVVLAAQYIGASDPFNSTNVINDSAPSPDWTTHWSGSVAWSGSASSASAGNADPTGANAVALNGADGFDGFVKLLRSGGSWNPSTQGAFDHLGGSIDTLHASAGPSVIGEAIGIHIILIQASTAYTAQIATLTTTDNTQRTHPFTLEAGDFTKQDGFGPATPDFTAAGGLINMGMATSKVGGTATSWAVNFDNVVFNVNQASGTVAGGEAAVDHIQIRICGTT
ncbi:MAG: hypothetical protein K8T91_21390 [Planctomycetes bacterium]|nr:hypothetical protein [Planctomycetota bacterium]